MKCEIILIPNTHKQTLFIKCLLDYNKEYINNLVMKVPLLLIEVKSSKTQNHD